MSGPAPGWEARGGEALGLVDEILAARPKKDGHKLTQATHALSLYREGLIERASFGGEAARRDLEHVNAVLSIVAGVHFPLGTIPWDELEGARRWLADLVHRLAHATPTAG